MNPEENDMTVIASGACGDDATWELDDQGTITISGTGYIGSSDTYGNHRAYPSDYSYFLYRNQIKRVVINEGITGVGYHAFDGYTSVEEISLPDSLTHIFGAAFVGCAVHEVTIPANVLWFGQSGYSVDFPQRCAFEDLPNLEKVYYNSTTSPNLSKYGGFDRYGYNVGGTELILGDDVTLNPMIEFFKGNALKRITVGSSFNNGTRMYVYEIKKRYSSIVLPALGTTNTICEYAKSILGPEDETTIRETNGYIYGFVDNNVYILNVKDGTYKDLYLPGQDAFPQDVADNAQEYLIFTAAFRRASNIESVTIPGTYVVVSESVFLGCSSLKSVVLMEGITTLEKRSFQNLSSLEYFELPSTLVNISTLTYDPSLSGFFSL